MLIGGVNFTDLALTLKPASGSAPAVVWAYGKFLQAVFDFAIVAFVIFLAVKGINRLKREEPAAPAAAGAAAAGGPAGGNPRPAQAQVARAGACSPRAGYLKSPALITDRRAGSRWRRSAASTSLGVSAAMRCSRRASQAKLRCR